MDIFIIVDDVLLGEITGAKLMDVTLRERRRIVERKKEKKSDSSFSNSL